MRSNIPFQHVFCLRFRTKGKATLQSVSVTQSFVFLLMCARDRLRGPRLRAGVLKIELPDADELYSRERALSSLPD